MELLGQGNNASTWKTTFLNMLAGSEGTEGRDVAIEGGGGTRGYGITKIPKALQGVADTLTDKQLASRIIDYYEGVMRKIPGLDFDNMPDYMKIVATDVMYNTGSLFKNFKGNLIDKNYEMALKDMLDMVSANDPKANNTSKILKGLANRRMDTYNFAAEQMGIPTITSNNIFPSKKEGSLTDVIYNFSEGDPLTFNINKGMHSDSMNKSKPTGYDPMEGISSSPEKKESMLLEKDLLEQPSYEEGELIGQKKKDQPMITFASDSLMFPGQDIDILGGL